MMTKNGKTAVIEEGVPGCPHIRHLQIHTACDRFFASRGIVTQPAFRQSAFLYRPIRERRPQ